MIAEKNITFLCNFWFCFYQTVFEISLVVCVKKTVITNMIKKTPTVDLPYLYKICKATVISNTPTVTT